MSAQSNPQNPSDFVDEASSVEMEDAKHRVAHKVGQTVGDATEKLIDLGERAGHAVVDHVGHLRDKAHHYREKARQYRQEARDYYNRSKRAARRLEQGAERQIREHPWRALLIAGGVGAIVYLMLRRKD
jgi:ElaB/YqjD/DUF883 family membrane-anchored ribosome-binding protein